MALQWSMHTIDAQRGDWTQSPTLGGTPTAERRPFLGRTNESSPAPLLALGVHPALRRLMGGTSGSPLAVGAPTSPLTQTIVTHQAHQGGNENEHAHADQGGDDQVQVAAAYNAGAGKKARRRDLLDDEDDPEPEAPAGWRVFDVGMDIQKGGSRWAMVPLDRGEEELPAEPAKLPAVHLTLNSTRWSNGQSLAAASQHLPPRVHAINYAVRVAAPPRRFHHPCHGSIIAPLPAHPERAREGDGRGSDTACARITSHLLRCLPQAYLTYEGKTAHGCEVTEMVRHIRTDHSKEVDDLMEQMTQEVNLVSARTDEEFQTLRGEYAREHVRATPPPRL